MKRKHFGDRNLIGCRVNCLRRKRGISLKMLVARLQVSGADLSYASVCKLEGQNRQVTDRELVLLAQILEVTPNDLLGYSEEGITFPHASHTQ